MDVNISYEYSEAPKGTASSEVTFNNRERLITSRRNSLQNMLLVSTGVCLIPWSCQARNLPLATGADPSNTGTVETLVPIVRMRQFLRKFQKELSDINNAASQPDKLQLPSSSIVPREETTFKRVLDAYSDPVSYKQKFVDQNAFLVYYTKGFDGPGRPSIESDLPVKQTLQYGARNDAWVAWDDVLAEWEFCFKDNGGITADNKTNVLEPLQRVVNALDAYLALAPPEDLQKAQQQVAAAK